MRKEQRNSIHTRQEIKTAVLSALLEMFPNHSEILDEDTQIIADLNADSMDLIQLKVLLDDSFSLDLNIDHLPSNEPTVRSLIDLITRLVLSEDE